MIQGVKPRPGDAEALVPRQRVRRQKARVVPGSGILRPGIPQKSHEPLYAAVAPEYHIQTNLTLPGARPRSNARLKAAQKFFLVTFSFKKK